MIHEAFLRTGRDQTDPLYATWRWMFRSNGHALRAVDQKNPMWVQHLALQGLVYALADQWEKTDLIVETILRNYVLDSGEITIVPDGDSFVRPAAGALNSLSQIMLLERSD